MVKNRIISACIVLIFALGVALPGIFFRDLGKKTTAGENAEEVTPLAAWSLTFYERWGLQNSVYKVEGLCGDLELMEGLETAKKAKEEVEAVLDTPWAKAYCAFLEEALQDDPSKMKTTGFRLVYIDDDEVPELLIMEDNFHGAGIKVCTYYQNRVVETGEFGSMGHFRYAAGCGMIHSSFTNFGEVYSDYYVLDQGEAKKIAAFHAYPDLDYEDDSVMLYEVDNETVTKALYNEKWREFENDAVYYDMDYVDGIFVEDLENLKRALAQEIVALGLENPYFYPKEIIVLSADIKCEGGDLWEMVEGELQVKWLKRYDKGDLFRLSVFIPDNVVNYLGAERKNIYFYVTPDEIYRLWSYCYDEKERSVISFYDNDNLFMETFDTDEKLMENGELVCCMERVEDELGKEDLGENEMGTPISEIGEHFAIIPEGERVTCSRYDTKPNGETDFYESFIWERGKGLVSYRSGFRAEAEILYVENISVKEEAQAER